MISRREFLKTAIALPTCLSIVGQTNSAVPALQKPAHLLRLASPLFDRYWNKETFEITDCHKCVVCGDTPIEKYWYYRFKDECCDVIIPSLEIKIDNPIPNNPEESCKEAIELMFDKVEQHCRDTIIAAGLEYIVRDKQERVVKDIRKQLGENCHIFTGWKDNLIVGVKRNSGKLVMPIFHQPTLYYKSKEYGEGPLALVKLGIAVLTSRVVCVGYDINERVDISGNPANFQLQPAILS